MEDKKKIICRITSRRKKIVKPILYCRDNGKCHICKEQVDFKEATIDHVLALSNGGTNKIENLAIAHPKCNHDKGIKENPNQSFYHGKKGK